MQIHVNLATRPFVELRPFFLRLRLMMAGLVAVGLALAVAAHLLSVRAEHQQAALNQLRNQTVAAQQSRLHTEQRMRDPVNARVLDRAHFLNTLFLRKSFSWTAVMMDLENVLPNGVQVTSIEPQVSPDGNVAIRLRVAGERANTVQLVRNLERSRRFLQPRLLGEASQAKENNASGQHVPQGNGVNGTGVNGPAGPPGVEFEILATYNPLPPGESFNSGHRPGVAATFETGGLPTLEGAVPVIHPAPRNGVAPRASSRARTSRDGIRLAPYRGAELQPLTPKRGGVQ